ncbi:MAG: hypothetical protein LKE37_00110 [Atopobiaceae bacterium]|jgi:hypothetical protein|nr:hypothetical protein [Atopobiaceae bacterium]
MARKKLVTLLGIASVVLLAIHLAWGAALFAGLATWSPAIARTGRILVTCFALHVVLALWGVFRDWKRTRGQVSYARLALANTAQIASGILVVALSGVHGYLGSIYFKVSSPAVVAGYLVTNVLLFFACCVHVSVAGPHVLVSLGLVASEKAYRRAQVAFVVASVAVFGLAAASNVLLAVVGVSS